MKHYIKSNSNDVTLLLEYYPYERYYSPGKKIVKVHGLTLLDALCNMVDHLRLYFDSDDIEERDMTAEEVISKISADNGDGCDYVVKLQDLSTGKVLLEFYDPEIEEEW